MTRNVQKLISAKASQCEHPSSLETGVVILHTAEAQPQILSDKLKVLFYFSIIGQK